MYRKILTLFFVFSFLTFFLNQSQSSQLDNISPCSQIINKNNNTIFSFEEQSLKLYTDQASVFDLLSPKSSQTTISKSDKKKMEVESLIFKASYLIHSGKTKDAIPLLEKAQKILPDEPYIQVMIANALNLQGEKEKALATLNELLEKNPKYGHALLFKAKIYEDSRDNQKAIKTYEEILKIQPENLQALESTLDYYFREKADLDRTIEICKKLLLIERRNLYALLILGSAYSLKGDIENAIQQFDLVIRIRSDLIWRIIQMGEVLQNNGQVGEAYKLFRHLFIKYPKNEQIKSKFEEIFYQNYLKNQLGKIEDTKESKKSLEQKASEELLKEYRRMLKENPESTDFQEVLSKKLLALNHLSEAKENAFQILKTSPENLSSLVTLGQIYFLEENYTEALKYLDKAIQLETDNAEVLSLITQICQKQKNFDKIENLLKNALLAHPENEKLLLLMGEVYRKQGKIDKALSYFEKADEAKPEALYIIQNLLSIYLQEDMKDSLNQYLKKIENRAVAKTPDGQATIGIELFNYRQYDFALRFLQNAESRNQNDLGLTSMLALVYTKLGEFEPAIKLFENIKNKLKEKEGILRFYLLYGQIFYEQKNHKRAIEILKEGLAKYPDSIDIYHSLVTVFNELKEYDKVKELLEEARKNLKGEKEFTELEALVFTQQKKYSDALPILEKLAQENSENDYYHFSLGALYFEMKDLKKAEESYKKAIAINPDNYDALNNLGYLLTESENKLEEAKGFIENALQRKPYAGYILDSLGWVYFKLGDYNKSKIYLERAYLLSDEDQELFSHLSQLYEKIGEVGKATEFKEKESNLKANKAKKEQIKN